MPIFTEQWRADIGQFHFLTHPIKVIYLSLHSYSKIRNIFSLFFIIFCCLFLQNDHIEGNCGPKKKSVVEYFSSYNWKVNSLAAHGYKKVSLLETPNAINCYDLTCISETS